MIRLACCCLALSLLWLTGCGEKKLEPVKVEAVPASEIPELVKRLESKRKLPGMAMKITIQRLGEAGPAAKSAVPALKKVHKTADPELQKVIDEALAKIGE